MKNYILSFDIGTTSTRALLFDKDFNIVGAEQREITQFYPHPNYVEQNPEELVSKTIEAGHKLIEQSKVPFSEILSIGITNQRETTILWEKKSGKPLYNAIVWQDKRTAVYCQELIDKNFSSTIGEKTGLKIDPYFSAAKLKWLLDHVEGARQRAEDGDLCFGTVDAFFLWHLSKGAVHATDVSNASRTMLYNINTLQWDESLLALFDIPPQILPEVKPSAGFFALTAPGIFGDTAIPVNGMVGDQQAALFGQACFEVGTTKNTYGTGCFILMNCGNKPVVSENGLITTIAWQIGSEVSYALEGSVFVAGALIKWLRDNLGLFNQSAETEQMAYNAEDSDAVYFVPAFAGLGAPYWDMKAKGLIVGLGFDTTKEDIVKAALNALAFQTRDVIAAMEKDSRIPLKLLNVDGGAAVNNYLMQFQADILNTVVVRPEMTESTALGAAMMAGIGAGLYSLEDLKSKRRIEKQFRSIMPEQKRKMLNEGWLKALEKARL